MIKVQSDPTSRRGEKFLKIYRLACRAQMFRIVNGEEPEVVFAKKDG